MKKAEDDISGHLFERLVSEDGKIEMGIHPVLFGYRVRAGYIGDMAYKFDWCGGDDQSQVEMLYSIAKNVLEHKNGFEGIPPCSKIKPFFNDKEFVKEIESLVIKPLEIVKIQPLNSYGKEMRDFIRNKFNF